MWRRSIKYEEQKRNRCEENKQTTGRLNCTVNENPYDVKPKKVTNIRLKNFGMQGFLLR